MKTLACLGLLLVACGSSSESSPSRASGPSGESDAAASSPADASASDASVAKDGAVDASPNLPTPEAACASVLTTAIQCTEQVASTPEATGGDPPDGDYDRITISSPLSVGSDPACSRGVLRLDRGTFEMSTDVLGGPFVVGGSTSHDSAQHTFTFTPVCESPADSNQIGGLASRQPVLYTWSATDQTLTIVLDWAHGSIPTTWVYKLR